MHCFEPNFIAAQQLAPSCARELASKRALHPINNVKQPTHKRRLSSALSCAIHFLSAEVCEEAAQEAGGAERDRTDDLLLAKQALSQLSYGPNLFGVLVSLQPTGALALNLVGQGRFELPTSRLSSARSNQLSY